MSDPTRTSTFDPIEAAVAAIGRGEIVVVADDEDRENEGDLIMAADAATPEAVAFIVRHTSGVICVGLPEERCDRLGLPLMVPPGANREVQGTAFTVTVDLRAGTSTGISATDRAATLRALADPASSADDFNRPGHVFPLRARAGGVLSRAGHTEAAVDLARLAGRAPAGVLCEVVAEGPAGGMARVPELRAFADRHGLVLVSIADLVRHRLRHEQPLRPLAETRLPTPWAEFRSLAFADDAGHTHLALVLGDVAAHDDRPAPLVRVHSECLTGDVFASQRCDCGAQLHGALERIAAEGRGVVVYLRGHEGRGIGLGHKLRAYELQELGFDTVDANAALGLPVDGRDYAVAGPILGALGVGRLRLSTNNPAKLDALLAGGLDVERVASPTSDHPEARRYLRTKRDRMGHLLPDDDTLGVSPAKEIR